MRSKAQGRVGVQGDRGPSPKRARRHREQRLRSLVAAGARAADASASHPGAGDAARGVRALHGAEQGVERREVQGMSKVGVGVAIHGGELVPSLPRLG